MVSQSIVNADSLLAIDVGSVNTRAMLFDMVQGRYRFLASGRALSSANAPMLDVSEGIFTAIQELTAIVGRDLIGEDDRLIVPSLADGSGVDQISATISAGEPLKVVAVGLLDGVSLKSVNRLANLGYMQVVDHISVTDRRRTEEQIDAILKIRPDVIIIAGGTNKGASRSILKIINALGMAVQMLPHGHKPDILFSGNEALSRQITEFFAPIVPIHQTPNLRPTLDHEQLGPALIKLNELSRKKLAKRILGVQELDQWTGGHLIPTAQAIGRVARFLSTKYVSVLAVDVGATSTTIASAYRGDLQQQVYYDLGMGPGIGALLRETPLKKIHRWLPYSVQESYLEDYLHNKMLYPASLTATHEDMVIEQAATREVIRLAIRRSTDLFQPELPVSTAKDAIPGFDYLLIGGSAISLAPDRAQSLLMILDALQPIGISRIILDPSSLAAGLGSAAAINPLLAVQVMDSNSFVHLGDLVVPVCKARLKSPVLKLTITYDTGQEKTYAVLQGSLQVIPLPIGRAAQLYLQPLQRADVGMGGPGKGGRLKVIGGPFGVIVDARGRPLKLPKDINSRQEIIRDWLNNLDR